MSHCRKLIATVDVKPPIRLKEAYSRMEDKRAQALTAPCGNFSAMYQCMCDYHAVDFMEDVAWVSFLFILLKFPVVVLWLIKFLCTFFAVVVFIIIIIIIFCSMEAIMAE